MMQYLMRKWLICWSKIFEMKCYTAVVMTWIWVRALVYTNEFEWIVAKQLMDMMADEGLFTESRDAYLRWA